MSRIKCSFLGFADLMFGYLVLATAAATIQTCIYDISKVLPLTSVLNGSGWLTPRHATPRHATPRPLFRAKETRYPLYTRMGRPQGLSGRVRKISRPLGFDPRTVQPVASRYSYWATPAHVFTTYPFQIPPTLLVTLNEIPRDFTRLLLADLGIVYLDSPNLLPCTSHSLLDHQSWLSAFLSTVNNFFNCRSVV
jgi:hypothetical protein